MKALIQRVREASVSVNGALHGRIEKGLLIFLGIKQDDTPDAALYLAQRCSNLRIFGDEKGNMNLSVKDVGGSVLVISQFTLYADTRKGNRPSFTNAAPANIAEPLYLDFARHLSDELGPSKVCTGVFRAMMGIHLVNDGPVTVLVESKSPEDQSG